MFSVTRDLRDGSQNIIIIFCSGKTLAKFMIIDDPVVSYTSQVEITILSCFQVTLSVACARLSDSIVGKK